MALAGNLVNLLKPKGGVCALWKSRAGLEAARLESGGLKAFEYTSIGSKRRKGVFVSCSRKERRQRARRWHQPLL